MTAWFAQTLIRNFSSILETNATTDCFRRLIPSCRYVSLFPSAYNSLLTLQRLHSPGLQTLASPASPAASRLIDNLFFFLKIPPHSSGHFLPTRMSLRKGTFDTAVLPWQDDGAVVCSARCRLNPNRQMARRSPRKITIQIPDGKAVLTNGVAHNGGVVAWISKK